MKYLLGVNGMLTNPDSCSVSDLKNISFGIMSADRKQVSKNESEVKVNRIRLNTPALSSK